MEFKLDRRRVNRFNLPAAYWFNLADGMFVNKLNATALSPIVKIEVGHLRVSKALLLTNMMLKSYNGSTGHVIRLLTNVGYYTRPYNINFDSSCAIAFIFRHFFALRF